MGRLETDRPGNAWVIGVTGGVGAGKSRVLGILKEEYGAHVLLADEVAAELEKPGQEGFRRLVEHFGEGILSADGKLDRAAFADRIFKDPGELAKVNAMIHPLAWQELKRQVTALASSAEEGQDMLIVVEAALFDGQSRRLCDTLWYVDASEENRILRLMENRGYTREKCRDIIRRQPAREEFLAFSDAVIDNNGTPEETRQQLARLLGSSRRCPAEGRGTSGCRQRKAGKQDNSDEIS